MDLFLYGFGCGVVFAVLLVGMRRVSEYKSKMNDYIEMSKEEHRDNNP